MRQLRWVVFLMAAAAVLDACGAAEPSEQVAYEACQDAIRREMERGPTVTFPYELGESDASGDPVAGVVTPDSTNAAVRMVFATFSAASPMGAEEYHSMMCFLTLPGDPVTVDSLFAVRFHAETLEGWSVEYRADAR